MDLDQWEWTRLLSFDWVTWAEEKPPGRSGLAATALTGHGWIYNLLSFRFSTQILILPVKTKPIPLSHRTLPCLPPSWFLSCLVCTYVHTYIIILLLVLLKPSTYNNIWIITKILKIYYIELCSEHTIKLLSYHIQLDTNGYFM